MKLAYLTTLYPAYLKKFYHNRAGLEKETYQTQKQAINHDVFGWADFWGDALKPLGYETIEICANVQPLQYAWARENGITVNHEWWFLQIADMQITKFAPEILFVDDYHSFSYEWLVHIKKKCPSIKLIMGWCGAPYNDTKVFKAYDIVLSCIPEMVDEFKRMGHNSFYMNHAFDPRILERIDLTKEPKIDFSFVGQIVMANKYHLKRAQLLSEIAKQIDIDIFSPMFEAQNKIKEFEAYLRPSVFGLEMFQTLRNSKLTFNSHIDVTPRSASNMRLFEATGVGTCLVTDWKENIHELFEPDKEVVTYKTADECIQKVKELLASPKEFKKIVQAGQQRTLKEHTYTIRALQLDKIIRNALVGKQRSNLYGFFGNYDTWGEALAVSTGYDTDVIFDKVKNAMLKVKNGEAAYERDSVLFQKIQYSWPLLSALLWIASCKNNSLNIIDFGGSLGSSYYQNRKFLQHLRELRWNIVEQPHFVECGKKYFTGEGLNFHANVDECLQSENVDAILFSGVIQYIEKPYELLQDIMTKKIDYIIFDRTSFMLKGDDRITLQTVPPSIYEASYPAYFLNVHKFVKFMMQEYQLVVDFPVFTDKSNLQDSAYLGFLFERKKN